jgi:hypothetical protein
VAINVRRLVKDWDNVIIKLCDEVTPHDVIEVVATYLDLIVSDCEQFDFECEKVKKAKELLNQALQLLDPELPEVKVKKS